MLRRFVTSIGSTPEVYERLLKKRAEKRADKARYEAELQKLIDSRPEWQDTQLSDLHALVDSFQLGEVGEVFKRLPRPAQFDLHSRDPNLKETITSYFAIEPAFRAKAVEIASNQGFQKSWRKSFHQILHTFRKQ